MLILSYSCTAEKSRNFEQKEVYKTDSLVIRQIAPHSYQHISYLKTESFGLVACNGMIAVSGNEAIVFDTPTGNQTSLQLINWITNKLNKRIKGVVATHFHDDCLGGLKAFHEKEIASYASFKTIELAKKMFGAVPQNGFSQEKKITLDKAFVDLSFFGEGHTVDNTVAYYPKDKVLFGGCLIKEVGASKGYLGDSNVEAWSKTVQNVKQRYPNVQTVVPGHGKIGGMELLDYTIALFNNP